MFDDVSSVTLKVALDGLSQRQKLIADNIANIETPGYLAKKVKFEDALRSAAESGDPGSVTPTVARSLEPTRENGNNVNLDEETLSNVDTNLRYQLAVNAMDGKYKLMREVIKGQ
ncbi:flagellar basal body rod protein FlgB [Luedemannella flava]|uniref:Flagellar basal body rod protein FlgB n=1 Tax=Luedemannella flava TaxID=349316 RepID=A0ABP4YM50_9ACTN